MQYLRVTDLLLLPIVIFFIYYFAQAKKNRKINTNPEFAYYLPGLTAKVFGGLAFALIYALYYGGGDTIGYFHDAICWNKLLFSNPKGFWNVFWEGTTEGNYWLFTHETGYPIYWRDVPTRHVVRFAFLAAFFGFRSFLIATVIFALISFEGIWRLYRVFISEFKDIARPLAIAIIFLPSLIFWGSGILKDTITLSAVGYFIHAYFWLFIKRKNLFSNTVAIVLSSAVILMIKPYIFVALAPGSIIWVIDHYSSKIRGSFIRYLATPIFLGVSGVAGYIMLLMMSSQLGDYSVDRILDKAVVTQSDLKQDYYGGNAFDIGDLEPTVGSLVSHSHLAINAALFRPYLWESQNLVMFISGIENFFILVLTLIVLYRARGYKIFKYIVRNHLLKFSLIFSLFFAFSVGISTSNFGSMVRYRIPLLPFYVSSLFILNNYFKVASEKREIAEISKGFSLQ